MTDAEVMAEVMADSTLNKARAVFSSEWARLERRGVLAGPIEYRRMEFQAVRRIAAALGVTL